MQSLMKQAGSPSQIGQDDPAYDYLKNIIGGKVTRQRYIDFVWPSGVPSGLELDEIVPAEVEPMLEK
mgnify:CR=1 FL=1|jgi:hypothetical protein